jgi:hypothetical protein
VLVGGSTPVSGAQASLTGMAFTVTPPYFTTIGPFTGTTDAQGMATVNASWSAAQAATTWTLNVTSAGKTTSVFLFLGPFDTSNAGWQPPPVFGFGCELQLRTDPTALKAGQSATLKLRLTSDGGAVASQSVARFAWREGATGTAQAGNVTTDATGNFTLTYAIPSDWKASDTLQVRAVCPDGNDASTSVEFASTDAGIFSGNVRVSASGRLGGTVHVTATYLGTSSLDGVTGFAAVAPGNSTAGALAGLSGTAPMAPLVKAGTSFSADVSVPSWYPEGDYTVFVFLTNHAATSNLADQVYDGNWTFMHLSAAGSTTPSGGFLGLPGFDAAAAMGAAAMSALVAVEVRRRRAA